MSSGRAAAAWPCDGLLWLIMGICSLGGARPPQSKPLLCKMQGIVALVMAFMAVGVNSQFVQPFANVTCAQPPNPPVQSGILYWCGVTEGGRNQLYTFPDGSQPAGLPLPRTSTAIPGGQTSFTSPCHFLAGGGGSSVSSFSDKCQYYFTNGTQYDPAPSWSPANAFSNNNYGQATTTSAYSLAPSSCTVSVFLLFNSNCSEYVYCIDCR